tara:strand:- start:1683 stop:2975 length:1293 start_codon:yes stop_codon:yes gene_type:complete
MKICAIILSAGKSRRFNSSIPKFIQLIAGQPIIDYNLDTLNKIKLINKIEIISSHNYTNYFKQRKIDTFVQSPVDGTGGALRQFYNSKKLNYDYFLIMLSDTPVFDNNLISNFIQKGIKSKSDISVLGQEIKNPFGYGRIIFEKHKFKKILEEKDCNKEEKKINLINTGIFLISKNAIKNINQVKRNIKNKEFYITDLIDISSKKNLNLNVYLNKSLTIKGVNTQADLKQLDSLYQNYLKEKLMNKGIRIIQPDTVYIENNVKIGKGVIIEPNVIIKRGVRIKENSLIKSFSYLEGCSIGRNCTIGPFARVRPEANLEDNVKIGNFVEIKKSKLSRGVKVNHLSYIGDTYIGKNTNIGAGTITCNYDGKNKLSCKIGNNCFIGTNTSIVAPVKIGDNAYVAAGSVITKNIANNQFSISRAVQKNKKNIKK